MPIPLQISFRGMAHSSALDDAIRAKAEKLDRYYQHVMSCRVVVELAVRHRHEAGHSACAST